MKTRRVQEAVRTKSPGDERTGKETQVWVKIDGRKRLRITLPKGHSSDLKPGTLNSIRKQLKLDSHLFEDFVDCKMTGSDYERHVRELIADGRA